MWIEKWLEDNNGYWKTHLEFPGGSRERNIDALVLSKLAYGVINGTRSSPVSYGWSDAPVIGEVFEIEPMNAARIAEGRRALPAAPARRQIIGRYAPGVRPVHRPLVATAGEEPSRAAAGDKLAGREVVRGISHPSHSTRRSGGSSNPAACPRPLRAPR